MAEAVDRCCATCVFWHRHGAPLSAASRKPTAQGDLGTCQARPPSVAPSPQFAVGVFPETHASRFCGDWQDEWFDDGDGGEELPVSRIEVPTHLRSVA